MQSQSKQAIVKLLTTLLVVSGCLSSGFASAAMGPVSPLNEISRYEVRDSLDAEKAITGKTDYFRLARGDSDNIRSRSEVVREVKKRYNAKVLKISLDRQQTNYRVRILLPNGKIRNITVRARG